MMIRVLLFAIFASWLAACESSGDSASIDGGNSNGGDNSITWGDWDIDNSLPELEGNVTHGQNSIISNSGFRNYVLYPVMQVNRKISQSIYDGSLLQRLKDIDKDKAKELFNILFGDKSLNNNVRYQKQMKCLADLHEIELEIQSLLVSAADPELRKGVFKQGAIDAIEEENSTALEQQKAFIDALWDEEHGVSDLGRLFQQYRLKTAAFLTLPFSNKTDDVLSNAWSCALTENIWEEQFEGLEFHTDIQERVDDWLSEDNNVTQANLPAALEELIILVNNFNIDDDRLGLGEANQALLDQALITKPEAGSGEPFERTKSYEGSLYSLAKLVCKNEFDEGHSNSSLCGLDQDADHGYTHKAAFSNRYQLTRDLNEQVASNVGNLIERIALLGTMSQQLIPFAKNNRAADFANLLERFESVYVDPLDERAEKTKGVAKSGCEGKGKGVCEQTLLASFEHASQPLPKPSDFMNDGKEDVDAYKEAFATAIREWKPGINQLCNWDGEPNEGCPEYAPDLRLTGDNAYPLDEGNKNVLRFERVAHAMEALWGNEDSGIVEVLGKSDELVDELAGAWNHLITLLLITFGWLRLRSRRLA